MRFLIAILLGAVIGGGYFLIKNSTDEESVKGTQSKLASVLEIDREDCFKGPDYAEVQELTKVNCTDEFNYYAYLEIGYEHYEFNYQAISDESEFYCNKYLKDDTKDLMLNSKLVTFPLIPKMMEWNQSTNDVVCMVHLPNFNTLKLRDVGR